MKHYHLIILIFILFYYACGSSRTAITYDEYVQANTIKYRVAEISEAEKLLLDLIETTKEYQSEGVEGINYDWALSFSYARLYLIYQRLSNKTASQKYLNKIKSICHVMGYSPDETKIEIEKLVKFVQDIDVQHSVKWINEK